jgi:hypothetical protein
VVEVVAADGGVGLLAGCEFDAVGEVAAEA